MPSVFPIVEWHKESEGERNFDEHYSQIARNWEGDMYFVIDPDGNSTVLDFVRGK